MAKLVGTPLDFRGNGISNVGGISAPNGTSGQCFAADGTLKDIPSIDGTVKYIVVDVDNTGKGSAEGGDTMLHPNQYHAMYCLGGQYVQTYKYNDEGSAIGIRVLAEGKVDLGNTGIVTGHTVMEKLNALAQGEVKEGDTNFVTGNTMYSQGLKYVQNIGTNYTDPDTGQWVTMHPVAGSIYLLTGEHCYFTAPNKNGDTITFNVEADGAVENGNTKLVTGGTVYDAIGQATGDLAKQSDVENLSDVCEATTNKVDYLDTQVSGLATRVGKVETAQEEYILTYPASDTAATAYYSHDGQRRKLTIISYKGTGTIQVTLPQSPSDGQRIEVFKRGTSTITFKPFSTSSDYSIDVMEVLSVISTDATNDLTPIAADTDYTMKGGSYLVMVYSSALNKWVGKELG